MSPQTKIPRQTPGQGLVPLTVLVTPVTKGILETLAMEQQRTVAAVVRAILDSSLMVRHDKAL